LIDEDGIQFKRIKHGPRHLVYSAGNLENNLDIINDPEYFTFLRVVREKEDDDIPLQDIKVSHVDVKYAPVFNEDEVSTYKPGRDLFSINDVVIQDYVKEAITTIPVEKIMEGYRLLQDEN
jgi:hypothetical protein